MIRTLLATTALATLLATGAIAQDATTTEAPADPNATTTEAPADTTATEAPADTTTTAPADDAMAADDDMGLDMATGYTVVDEDSLATQIVGGGVWSSNEEGAEHIGDVNDLVVGEDGHIQAVIIGVGGFLGIGEKNVAVDYSDISWEVAPDGNEVMVLPTTAEALTAAPDFVWVEDDDDAAAAPAVEPTNEEVANAEAAGTDAPDAMAGTTIDRSTLTEFDETTLTAEELIGVGVWGPNDENLGAVGDFLMGEDGKTVDAVIVDFGGFLGIGVKEVAVALDNADFAVDANGNHYMLLNATREQLEAAPELNRDTYATDRDNQRFVPAAG